MQYIFSPKPPKAIILPFQKITKILDSLQDKMQPYDGQIW